MARSDILSFLRDPRAFSAVPAHPDLWQEALDSVAIPAIEAARVSGGSNRTLREAQIRAWRALVDQRTGLILGPPGTGKTFTLSWMALAYLEAHRRAGRPCRIMVTAFTRNAAVNLLEAIAENARPLGSTVPVRFIGEVSDENRRAGVEYLPLTDFVTAIEPEHAIVGCTTWAMYRALDEGHHGGPKGTRAADIFDLVCIDEASQLRVHQALMALAGLRNGGRVLIAGDNKQLSPIGSTYTWAADDRTLGGSVYDFLLEAGIPEQRLNETFRLNEPLSDFPSRQFYGGDYFSAAAVKDQRLALSPGWEQGLTPWQRIALDPEYPVTVLLYDGPAAATRNQNEVEIVRQLVQAFWQRAAPREGAAVVRGEEFWSEQVAVVSPHRAQNVSIREALSTTKAGEGCVVETVERIQGRERDAIIASYTVADPEFALAEAEFLFSPQRFNVALTRARSKFILVISRALLQVVPSDETVFDAARLLREFVFECTEVGSVPLEPRPGQRLQMTILVRRFDETSPLPSDLLSESPNLAARTPPPPMTPALDDVLTAIRQLSGEKRQETEGKYGDVPDWSIAKRLARPKVDFAELRALLLNGHITLTLRQTKKGPGSFWSATPLEPERVPLPCDLTTVRAEVESVIIDLQGTPPYYERVRDAFEWVDEHGRDVFRPMIEQLAREGYIRIAIVKNDREVIKLEESPLVQTPPPPPVEELSDADFAVLNALEDVEAKRINFGVFEAWCRPGEIASQMDRNPHDVAESLRRLDAHGHVMRTEEESPRIRSRMAELAREVRYIKQRFKADDASERPYLVRSIKVIAKNRNKPVRDRRITEVLSELRQVSMGVAHAEEVLRALESVLIGRWGADPRISGFQERAIKALVAAWLGIAPLDAAVITADTGAGKTEAACLPIIVGAAIDALSGVHGVRAVLVYPRIRLASNQAQRLTSYLRDLCMQEGMPRLTIGLQTGDVRWSWDQARRQAREATRLKDGKPPLWTQTGAGRWAFPFFACPACDGPLTLVETGEPQDRLLCMSQGCGWSFDGWVGTKDGLVKAPPHIFLPVTESLHQWMQRPEYGALFGDLSGTSGAPAPPRAVLADEIHLYSLVAGAQVGYALRRLLARMRANGTSAPLAIGMSATLGDPARIWSELIGCSKDRVLHIGPTSDEREDNVRGREYFYFVQPEVESRGRDIAGASTTIQTLMCLSHGMRRRTGKGGGFRGIVFLDSIDKLKRLHGDYRDAEETSRLARLRTVHKGSTSRCASSSERCGDDPLTCDRFRDGECWYFAATDQAQWTARGLYEPGRNLSVCDTPIFSGARGNADEIVRQSDLVFATSSLEVGFDDPDMTLVYQHYAPQNLASFVQRKGRGGRGADDRPVTGVTLSVYSPKDTWYFRSPERMLNAADFDVPLNMDNFFVRRGQVLSLLLDCAARWIARRSGTLDPQRDMAPILNEADGVIREVFGSHVYGELEVKGLGELWSQALDELRREDGDGPLVGSPRKWAERLPQVPKNLFSPINLPLLTVAYPRDGGVPTVGEAEEDVTLAFTECAPGRATRRWGFGVVHWNPYAGPRAPMFAAAGSEFRRFKVDAGATDQADVGKLLPRDARALLRTDPEIEYIRPTRLPVDGLGEIRGRNWTPWWEYDEQTGMVRRRREDSKLPTIHHKSSGRLLGTVIAVADTARARRTPIDALAGVTDGAALTSYRCVRSEGRRTGLRVTHAFWGADVSLVLETRKGPVVERTNRFLRQVFTHSRDPNRPILFGYGMESEGIALEVDSKLIDQFVDEERGRLEQDAAERQWLYAQHFRYLVASGASSAGVNGFQARHLAELVVSAAAVPELRDALSACLRNWNWGAFDRILKDTYGRLLSQSPVLTGARIDALVDELKKVNQFREFLVGAVRASGDIQRMNGWLRTAILHGFAIRLKQLFVMYGHGDERKVLLHAMLPLQFDVGLHDRVTVCEKGGFGDGTTRSFLGRAEAAFQEWADEGVVSCPNARADQALADAAARDGHHAAWRRMNPTDPRQMEQIGRDLGLDPASDAAALQLVVRFLHGQEEIYGERFEYFDLFREIQAVRAALGDPTGAWRMVREPGTWELVGAVVEAAARGDASTPRWSRLLTVYGGIEDATLDESLQPRARLADQIYRLSARLCPDGCQACLHFGSDLMDDDLAAMTVSRRVLERFWGFAQAQRKQ